ncbi:MAG: MFS transporter [Candidatus Lokiarchaeota archaeon]|nr:MFS transporter [Candidatus Lokiarchaeota archaeon]
MDEENIKSFHSKGTMASYGFGQFLTEIFSMAFSAFSFFFYESEIGLNVWLVSLGYIIFAVWNAFNDPLVGYLTERPFKFTEKWGRRFPWMLLGGFPWGLSYMLIFMPPQVDPTGGAWVLFAWLVITTCLFDLFGSLFNVNYVALFPNKFRSSEERRQANGISIVIGIIGTVSGSLVPPLLITFGVLQSYVVQGVVIFLIAIIVVLLAIPGCRDDQMSVQKYLATFERDKDRASFFQLFKTTLKQKNFIAYVLIVFLYQVNNKLMIASIPYLVRFLLKMEAAIITVIMAFFLIAVLISTPIWVKIAGKTQNNRKIFLIAGVLLTIFTLPLYFINTVLGFIIGMFIWGTAVGGFWVMQMPIFGDVMDEAVIETQKREEGMYSGVHIFFNRLSVAVQATMFALVHSLTGFVEGAESQSALAIVGIKIHFALLPMAVLLIGVLIFWWLYDLTPEKVKENQLKLREMKI